MHALVTESAMPHLREIFKLHPEMSASLWWSLMRLPTLHRTQGIFSVPVPLPAQVSMPKESHVQPQSIQWLQHLFTPQDIYSFCFKHQKVCFMFLLVHPFTIKVLNTESSVLDIWWREDSRTLLYHTAREGSVFTLPAIALWNLNQDIIFIPNFMLVCYCNLWVWQDHLYFWLSCYISLP